MAENENLNENLKTVRSKCFSLEIFTPSDMFLSCKAKSVTVPSIYGTFEVLANHAPVLAAINPGTVNYVDDTEKMHMIFVESGIVEVKNNKVTFTVTSAELIEDIKISELEKLVDEANFALNQTDLKDIAKINTNRKIELIKQKIKAVQKLNKN
jgi:F-type H+-transporting ATPase subunit epsilon